MEVSNRISVETKQIVSQKQMESLTILSMTLADLHEFLQKEEIENPLLDYSMADEAQMPGMDPSRVSIRDHEEFYGSRGPKDGGNQALYEIPASEFSVKELVMSQISAHMFSREEQKIVAYLIDLLDGQGFFPVTPKEAAADLGVEAELVFSCLARLKTLEPAGIFAADLTECLELQVEGMEDELLLKKMIREHLTDIAEGKLSRITRNLGISSAKARTLISRIRRLNPRPLNGCAGTQTEYIIPDLIFRFADGQWTIELNDRWSQCLGVNGFYARMMEETTDEEMKSYFQEKLARARFVVQAVEQRRKMMSRLAAYLLEQQNGYLLGQAPLRGMTMEEAGQALGVHPSTVSRAIKGKYLSAPRGTCAIRDLFTAGGVAFGGTVKASAASGGTAGAGGEGFLAADDGSGEPVIVSQDAAMRSLKALIAAEDKRKPYSDGKLAALLGEQGIGISRRTVTKYRAALGIPGTFGRKEGD